MLACVVNVAGEVVCWGLNHLGQLGRGHFRDDDTKAPVQGLRDAVQVAVAAEHVCSVTRAGKVYCWGNNTSGQVGSRQVALSAVPVDLMGLE